MPQIRPITDVRNTTEISDMPYSYPSAYDDLLSSEGYKKLVVKNFIVLYIVSDSDKLVNIMRVCYGGSDYIKNI